MPTVQEIPGPRRRGRVAMGPAVRTGPVGEFAYRLWELKKAAGDPSYDRMRSEFGALASKSALSAAARGQRLPSWETTWEFVRSLEVGVLGEEVESVRRRWREHWDNAAAMSNDVTDSIDVPEPSRLQVAETVVEWPRSVRRRVRFALAGLIAATLLALAGVGELWWQSVLMPVATPDLAAHAPNEAPIVPGDASDFVADVTVPDGTQVRPNQVFVKTWEIRNRGTVPWAGRYLQREDPLNSTDSCASADRVPIPVTQPGQSVRISVTVRAPSAPGWCQARWRMVDEHGWVMLPGDDPLSFLVDVI